MEHTPGPWRAEPLRGTKQLSIVPHYDNYDRRSVASVVAVSGEPEMNHEANARLIARRTTNAGLSITYSAHCHLCGKEVP